MASAHTQEIIQICTLAAQAPSLSEPTSCLLSSHRPGALLTSYCLDARLQGSSPHPGILPHSCTWLCLFAIGASGCCILPLPEAPCASPRAPPSHPVAHHLLLFPEKHLAAASRAQVPVT